MNQRILHKRSKTSGAIPQASGLEYGEIAINYCEGSESINIKNSADKVVSFTVPPTVVQEIGTSTTDVMSQDAVTTALMEGMNTVTTLTNIPLDKRLVVATITTSQGITLHQGLAEMKKGTHIKVIVKNNSDFTLVVGLPNGSHPDTSARDTYIYVPLTDSLSLLPQQYGTINIDFDGINIYLQASLCKEEKYVGGEGIICLTDGTDYAFVKNSDLATFHENNPSATPIGLLVIPKSHTSVILKDGDPRKGRNIIMSLNSMSCQTPEEGLQDSATDNTVNFGLIEDLSLTDYNVLNCFTDSTQTDVTTNANGYMVTDNSTNTVHCFANKHLYYPNFSNLCPSPFVVVDGEWIPNEDYYGTAVSENNALSDFDGIHNTKNLTDLATGQRDWRTATVITNNFTDDGYCPAACCCARYKTTGTKSFAKAGDDYNATGVWYMPACGELGYIYALMNTNNSAIEKVNTVFDTHYKDIYYALQSSTTSEVTYNSKTYKNVPWGFYANGGSFLSRALYHYNAHTPYAFCAI